LPTSATTTVRAGLAAANMGAGAALEELNIPQKVSTKTQFRGEAHLDPEPLPEQTSERELHATNIHSR
jgi:hypothetical protein